MLFVDIVDFVGYATKNETSIVAPLVEHLFFVGEVVGWIPGRVIPNTFKMVLADFSLGVLH